MLVVGPFLGKFGAIQEVHVFTTAQNAGVSHGLFVGFVEMYTERFGQLDDFCYFRR